MAGHSNLIEETMQALDDGRHLLRQVAGVHDAQSMQRMCLPAEHPVTCRKA
jgi:hypothetical protein